MKEQIYDITGLMVVSSVHLSPNTTNHSTVVVGGWLMVCGQWPSSATRCDCEREKLMNICRSRRRVALFLLHLLQTKTLPHALHKQNMEQIATRVVLDKKN